MTARARHAGHGVRVRMPNSRTTVPFDANLNRNAPFARFRGDLRKCIFCKGLATNFLSFEPDGTSDFSEKLVPPNVKKAPRKSALLSKRQILWLSSLARYQSRLGLAAACSIVAVRAACQRLASPRRRSSSGPRS